MKRMLTVLGALLITVSTFAAPGPPAGGPQAGAPPAPPAAGPQGPNGGPGGDLLPPDLLAQFLGITDAQKASIEQLRTTLEAAVKPLAEQMKTNNEALKTAVESGDAAKAGQLLVANFNLGQQIKTASDTFRAGVDALLTTEQKAKMAIYNEIKDLRNQPRTPPAN